MVKLWRASIDLYSVLPYISFHKYLWTSIGKEQVTIKVCKSPHWEHAACTTLFWLRLTTEDSNSSPRSIWRPTSQVWPVHYKLVLKIFAKVTLKSFWAIVSLSRKSVEIDSCLTAQNSTSFAQLRMQRWCWASSVGDQMEFEPIADFFLPTKNTLFEAASNIAQMLSAHVRLQGSTRLLSPAWAKKLRCNPILVIIHDR